MFFKGAHLPQRCGKLLLGISSLKAIPPRHWEIGLGDLLDQPNFHGAAVGSLTHKESHVAADSRVWSAWVLQENRAVLQLLGHTHPC